MTTLGSAEPAASAAQPPATTPGLWRRLACFLYEGVLLFGVLMLAALAYGVLTQQRHALSGMHGLQAVVFGVLGLYFVGFWTRGGQTLAMKTWHIRLRMPDGSPVPAWRAVLRYLLSWLWFAPALAVLWYLNARDGAPVGTGLTGAALLAGVAGYVLLARLHPSRQFLHDLMAGTRLQHHRPPPRR